MMPQLVGTRIDTNPDHTMLYLCLIFDRNLDTGVMGPTEHRYPIQEEQAAMLGGALVSYSASVRAAKPKSGIIAANGVLPAPQPNNN